MSHFTKPIQLSAGVGISGFHCGDPIVDDWVSRHSSSCRKRGTAVIYASYCDNQVAGFYTLSTHSVDRLDVCGGWFVRNVPEQVPVVLLGMLGVDKKHKGFGLGASLLKDAIENATKVATIAGAKALVVDPSNERAMAFYSHFGFACLPGTNRMAIKL